jgi:hypothetical protein
MFSQQVLQRVLLSVMSFTRLPRKTKNLSPLRGWRVKLITLNRTRCKTCWEHIYNKQKKYLVFLIIYLDYEFYMFSRQVL